MTVEIKYSVRDLVGDMRDGSYDINDGATVSELIEASQKEIGIVLDDNVKSSFVFLINGKPAAWETTLKEGDKIRVLYKILGG